MFEAWTASQYRDAGYDELIERRDYLVNVDREGLDEGQYRSECELISSEFAHRNQSAELRALDIKAVAAMPAKSTVIERSADAPEEVVEDKYDTMEYRRAFKEAFANGSMMPVQYRDADAVTATSDVTSVIPTVTVNAIIAKLTSEGMIFPLVKKANVAAGLAYPTSTFVATASWVNEGAGSYTQKATTSSITFTNHKLRCEISRTMEVKTMSLSAFETWFVEQVSKAMLVAIETAIISGNGSGKPKGILAETPESGQAITYAYNTALSYQTLIDAEAAIPAAYENGTKWFMSKKTFTAIQGIVDDNGQPIARINYGIGNRPERMLLGREVVINPYVSDFVKQPSADTIFAFLFNPEHYLLNTIYNMGIQTRQNWDNEDWETKAVMNVDGKVLDKNSLVTLKQLKESL